MLGFKTKSLSASSLKFSYKMLEIIANFSLVLFIPESLTSTFILNMSKIILIIQLLLSIFCVVSSKEPKSQRIFGGTAAEDGQFPYMVDLSVLYRDKFYHICGGALIHSNWIITAGHCAYYVQKL